MGVWDYQYIFCVLCLIFSLAAPWLDFLDFLAPWSDIKNQRFFDKTLNKFIKDFVEKSSILGYFQRLFKKISIFHPQLLENYPRDRPQFFLGVSPSCIVHAKRILRHCNSSKQFFLYLSKKKASKISINQ